MSKKKRNALGFGLISLVIAAIAYAQADRFSTKDTVKFGSGLDSDKTIEADFNLSDNPKIKFDSTNDLWQFSNDGTNFSDFGSGSGGSGGLNILANPNFESGTVNWTGGGNLALETVDPGEGRQSARWNPSAAGQFLRSDAQEIPASLRGRGCLARFSYLWDTAPASESDAVLRVTDGSSALTDDVDINSNNGTTWRDAFVAFECPESGNLVFELESNIDSPVLIVDRMHLGSNTNEFIVETSGQMIAHAAYEPTAGCEWAKSTSSMGPFPIDTDCPAITVYSSTVPVDNTDNNLPDIDFDDLPAGRYEVTVTTTFEHSNATDFFAALAISDGTVTRGTLGPLSGSSEIDTVTLVGVFDHPGGAANFAVHGFSDGVSNIKIHAREFGGHNSPTHLSFTVKRFAKTQIPAVSLETQGWHIDANIGGGNISLGTGAVSDYTQMSNPSLDLIVNPGSAAVGISCSTPGSEEQEVGDLTCAGSEGDETAGIVFNAPYTGKYYACAQLAWEASHDSDGDILQLVLQVVHTSNNSTSILSEGGGRQYARIESVAVTNDQAVPFNVCGIFTLNAGKNILQVYYEQNFGATPLNSRILLDRAGGAGQRDMHWTVIPLTQNFPQAIAITEDFGKFTPTVNAISNLDSATAKGDWDYFRRGDSICVFGAMDVDPTSSGSDILFRISNFPINPTVNFSNNERVAGFASSFGNNNILACIADDAPDEIQCRGEADTTVNLIYSINYCYSLE